MLIVMVKLLILKYQIPSEPEKVLMPAAAKIAREKNIDVNKIEGSGKAGRITKEDILKTDSNSTKEKSSVPIMQLLLVKEASKGFLCQD